VLCGIPASRTQKLDYTIQYGGRILRLEAYGTVEHFPVSMYGGGLAGSAASGETLKWSELKEGSHIDESAGMAASLGDDNTLLPWEGENEFGEGRYVQKRFNRMECARPWARPPDFPCSPDLAPHDPLHDPIVRRVVPPHRSLTW
jgi:hypothetical protein